MPSASKVILKNDKCIPFKSIENTTSLQLLNQIQNLVSSESVLEVLNLKKKSLTINNPNSKNKMHNP